jgi:GxxExxY protein
MVFSKLIEEPLTDSVIGAFYEVYNTLGFGFRELVYVLALEQELISRGHRVAREVWIPVLYKGRELCRQRVDMIADEKLVIETKSGLDLPKTGTRQLLNYLRATKLKIGLLLHFGAEPKFYRLVN